MQYVRSGVLESEPEMGSLVRVIYGKVLLGGKDEGAGGDGRA